MQEKNYTKTPCLMVVEKKRERKHLHHAFLDRNTVRTCVCLLTLKMIVVSISRWKRNISKAHAAKLGFRLPFCHFLADVLSARGTSWHSVLHRWIWINHQVQRLQPSQTQHAGITAEQGRRPWSSYWQAQTNSTTSLPRRKTPVPEVNCPSKKR